MDICLNTVSVTENTATASTAIRGITDINNINNSVSLAVLGASMSAPCGAS
jgi:hypothetical protein